MNKNRLGMAWLLLTVIMVGMSLSPMAGSTPLVSETVGSTEIVAEQNNDFSEDEDKSKDWAQEEQINEEDVALPEERLAPVNSGGPGQTRGTSTELAEEVFSEEEVDETEGRVIDQACTGDFNLDLDGDADLQDWGLGYPSELDAAPEVLEDFQSNDDFTGEEGYFGASDSNWGVTDTSWTTWGPDSGPNRELVMAGQRNYNQYQTAYLIAGTYNLHMKDTYGDGWNGNTFKLINADGVAVDQATLSYGGAGDADITVPADGFYHTDWTVGSWQEEVYWSLERHSYNLGGGGGSSFTPDPLPFTLGATTGTTKALAAGDYKFTLMDSFGDGWNGNRLKVYDSGGSLLYNFYIDNYCSGWWNCYNAVVNVNIPANDDYLFTFTGGSYQNEISVKVEAISVSVSAPSQFYMQSTPYGTGHGVMQTTTCINAGDYNQIFVSFAYHMFGTPSVNSGLRLDVRATDDRDGSAGADFFNGQWETVWERYGAGANSAGQVDPSGLLNGDWWFTENLEISADFCNDDGCAEMLSFRFYYDGGGSTRDDYAVDNFRIQGYGQFNDRDNDGIADGIDDCDGHDNIDGSVNAEFEHGMFSDLVIFSDGCPADTDGDGTYDVVDWCPNTHSDFTAVVAADSSLHGCAPGIPMTSSSVLYDGRSMETLAHVESFNSNQANPLSANIDARDGWTAIEDDGFYNWQIYSLYTAGIFEGDRSIVHAETNADWTEEAWMISPKISIPADSEFGNRMSFATMIEYFAFYGSYGYNSGEFAVYASTKSCQPGVGDPGSGNMINLMHDDNADTVPDPIFTVPYGLGFQTWEEQMFELPDWMNGEDVCFAFRNAAPTSGSMFLDLFQWYVQPTPPDSDNDGVWDARPESEDANGNPIYGADAGVDIDLCPDTPKGQAVVGMNLGVVSGQDGRPLSDQPWDVGCSAPLNLPYDQHFSALNMPSELQFGSSDGDGVQTAVENGNTWRALWNYYGPCGWDCLGIVIADDLPRIRYETKYMVMPMVEIGVDYDGVFLSWWDYVGQYYEWWNAVSYHGIQVAVADQTNPNRDCEVGADTDGDLDADAAFDENGVLTNGGYEEVSNQENPNNYGWFEHEVDLSSYVGKWVCVAFAFRSDYDQEWWIDDINMKGVILPPDMNDPTVVEFNPYTGADTYRADGRIVEITLADGESGIDNGQAPTTTSTGPTIDWSMSDGTSGSIAMSETTPCDMTILPYIDRECSFAGTLPAISAPGVTMTYTVSFQDVGFKTDNGLVHPVTGQDTGCMALSDFVTMSTEDANGDQPFTPDVSDAAIAAAIAAGTNVCGGPNEIVLGPYDYTLLDPMNAAATSSMMNLGMSGIENGNGDVYDVHMTYFSDVNEYVLEYEGACSGEGAVRANNWLDDDDLVSLGAQIDNMDITSPCGVNVAYHYNDAIDTWMAATLDSTGIDYNHNGLEAAQRDWATTTHFSSAMAQWSAVYDLPNALTSVNDITNGEFGAHTFGAASTDYAVLSASNAQGNYLTTADGMTLYIYWGDSDGQTCDVTCQSTWPAFYGGAGMMVDPTLDDDDFGTITNTEGNSQSTYQGWPLYTYAADSFPTDMNGNGVSDSGGTWYAAGAGYETGPSTSCDDSLVGGAPYAWSGTLCAGTYTLSMTDSWGDGWNGNEFAIVDSAGTYLWTATLGMGLSGTDTFTLAEDTAVTITCGGGAWQSEVDWTFVGGGEVGGFSISGTSNQIITDDVPAGSYVLDMQDSWGDGWNGNQWTLKDGTTTVAGPFTLNMGNSGQIFFNVDDDCNGCQAGITILGGWTYEVSWTMSAAAAQEDPFDSAEDFPGRMEASAPNGVGEFGVYNFPAGTYTVLMTDTYGDGWNGNWLALTDADDNLIARASIEDYASTGVAQFTIPEGTYNLDVGVTFPGPWIYEIGWSLVQQNYVPEGQHFTQLCVTSNGAIAFTSGDDCTSSTRITDLYGFNGLMYQTEDTGLAAGASVYLQVQNILPQKIVDFGPDNYIETGDGNQLSAWAHTVIEDTADNDGSLSLDLSRMHPDNPGLYFEVVSASEEAANSGCNYDLFFTGVTSGDQDVSFSLIPDATTNAPDDQVDYLQEGGIHQSTEGSCSLTVQLKEAGYLHHQTPLSMVVSNVAEERPDYAFTGDWDYELVSAVLPGTLVPLTVQVTNNDDGVASQNGAMYDHGHSIDVCFSTNDYDECYYSAWIVDPPAPGASVDVQGQFVLDSGTELLTTSLDVHTCDTQTSPGDTDNQGACTLDAQSAASLNGLTREGAKVTPYNYDETHSETLEQSTGDNDMAETNDRPLRISYGVANSVPSFAPSLMAIGLVGLFAAALVQGSRSDEEDEEELLIEDDAAVSPVIATILMVAITVVLSGVIYVWASQLATTSTKVTPLLTFKTEASETFWQITVTTAENPLALQAVFVQVEFIDDSCTDGYCIITQTIAEPQSYGFTPGNSDSFVTYMDMYDCTAGEGTDGCVAEFSAMDVLRINFDHPEYGTIDEGIVQLAYQAGGNTNILGEWNIDSSTPSIK